MTATAERVLEEIKTLPPADLRVVWQHLSKVLNNPAPAQAGDEREALEAVHSLYGRFAGGEMLVHLLRERARDRARDDEQLRRYRSRTNG
jgi:hypothetical protein